MKEKSTRESNFLLEHKKIEQTKDYYLNLLPSVDTITGYGTAILFILAGVLMLFYFMFILTRMWSLWSSTRNMLDVILDYKTYMILLLTIYDSMT